MERLSHTGLLVVALPGVRLGHQLPFIVDDRRAPTLQRGVGNAVGFQAPISTWHHRVPERRSPVENVREMGIHSQTKNWAHSLQPSPSHQPPRRKRHPPRFPPPSFSSGMGNRTNAIPELSKNTFLSKYRLFPSLRITKTDSLSPHPLSLPLSLPLPLSAVPTGSRGASGAAWCCSP